MQIRKPCVHEQILMKAMAFTYGLWDTNDAQLPSGDYIDSNHFQQHNHHLTDVSIIQLTMYACKEN
jgi:hypothetical protein